MHVHVSLLEHALDMHGALYVRVQLHFIQIPIVDATRCTILYLGGGHQSRYDHVYKKKQVTLLQYISSLARVVLVCIYAR